MNTNLIKEKVNKKLVALKEIIGMVEYHLEVYYTVLMTINLTLTLVVMLAACLCCKKKAPKNDLLGLEGMVKLKNPDEIVVVTTVKNSESQAELNVSTISNADSEKRSSTAAHRSLPDIPIAENNDNGSELYETVADKLLIDAQNDQNKSPTPSLKKQISVSQHSSISQADDVSSPYSRVKNLPHDYAKVRTTEHPYAQLNAPSASAASAASTLGTATINNNAQHAEEDIHHRNSQLSNISSQNISDVAPQAEIPAASAIAGMISASQDLPYMTPPIANQHFSGDSQDSSKGYTSISVREPLANILAQQPAKPVQRNPTLSRDTNDSHYATVSDDSDETYAAIEDPNLRNIPNAVDIYTSGSETYAQIQPMQSNPIVVSVEINNSSMHNSSLNSATLGSCANVQQLTLNNSISNTAQSRPHSSNAEHAVMPVPPPVDSLRAQRHSRQASSSSNNSASICNLGSPKPEKRQANSPLPPTPKSTTNHTHHLHTASNSNLTSGRNSVISVLEVGGVVADTTDVDKVETSPQRKHSKSLSPSKDIEGMYAKVIKKHKLLRNSPSSQGSSPVLARKQHQYAEELGISPLDNNAALLMDAQKLSMSSDKNRTRSNSYSAKDHGYETIPADGLRSAFVMASGIENRKSDCYANILQKERQQEAAAATAHTHVNAKPPKHYESIKEPQTANCNDPGYEQLQLQTSKNGADLKKTAFDYDPNYEVLKSAAHSEDGYAKVLEKICANLDTNTIDGYSKVKGEETIDSVGGYSTIRNADANHNYASILEAKNNAADVAETDHYARIAEALCTPLTPNCLSMTSPTSISSSTMLNNSSSITTVTTSTSSTMSSHQTPSSSQYESLTGSETDPNYESVCYLNSSRTEENPYERLHTEISDTQLSSSSLLTSDESCAIATESIKLNSKQAEFCNSANEQVDDYFQV